MTHFYRRQPPRGAKVAGGSPLGKGITAHFLFNGTWMSAVRGRPGNTVVTPGPVLASGPRGQYALGNGAGKVATDLLPARLGMTGAAPRSFVVEFDMPDSTTQRNIFSLGDSSTATHSLWALQTNTQFRTVRMDTYGNDINYLVHTVGGTTARVFLAVTYDGNVTLQFRSWAYLYATGAVVFNTQTSTLTAPLITGNTMPLCLMGGSAYSFASLTSALYHLSMYGGRCLTPAEIDRLYADRHQVMAPMPTFPYATATSAGVPAGGPATYSYTAAGGLQLSGAAPQARGVSKAPAGGVLLAGTAPQTRGRAVAPAGGLTLSGASSIVRSIARAAAGGLKFAGTAALSATAQVQARVITPVGGLLLAGAAAVSRATSRAISGGITFSGHAVKTAGAAGALLASLLPIFRRRRR